MEKYMVSINVIAGDESEAAKCAEILARVMVSLSLDDTTVSMNMSKIEVVEVEGEESEA